MRMFRNSIFSLANAFGFLIGIAMFGSMIFMPVYLQVVGDMSPTRSGLAMLPMIVGIFSTSLTAGQIMSRTGRYRYFPPAGAALVAIALLMLARLGVDSPYWFAALSMYVFGAGLGLSLQVVVVVVQNAVDRSDMGVATSSVAFFRQMGGSFGTALFGAILTSRLSVHLAEVLPGGTSAGGKIDTDDTDAIKELPTAVRDLVQEAFSRSLEEMFLTAVPIVLLAGVLALFIKEVPLGTRQEPEGSEGAGVPLSSASATSSPEAPTGSVSGSSSAASAGSSPTSV
jgi:MFS family permease